MSGKSEMLAPGQAVGFEIGAVECPDVGAAGFQRSDDQRGIGQIHRAVGIAFDPVDSCYQFLAAERQQFEPAAFDPVIER